MADIPDNSDAAECQTKPESAILLFDSTHQALKAEASIIEGGFWCDMVPRPPDAMTALCGLAIEIHAADVVKVRAALGVAGIAFELYRPEVEAF